MHVIESPSLKIIHQVILWKTNYQFSVNRLFKFLNLICSQMYKYHNKKPIFLGLIHHIGGQKYIQ
jgi:hypothetical protein